MSVCEMKDSLENNPFYPLGKMFDDDFSKAEYIVKSFDAADGAGDDQWKIAGWTILIIECLPKVMEYEKRTEITTLDLEVFRVMQALTAAYNAGLERGRTDK